MRGIAVGMTSDVMTGGSWAETTTSDVLAARAEADQRQHEADRLKAIRVVAGAARDTREAALLLDILGLSADDVRAAARNRIVAA